VEYRLLFITKTKKYLKEVSIMKKLWILSVVMVLFFAVSAFAQQRPVVNLYGAKGQVDLFAAELAKNGITSNNTYGEPAYGTYNGKKWPGVRYQIGANQTEDGWVPVSNSRVKDGTLCELQQSQAKLIADTLKRRAAAHTVAKPIPVPEPFITFDSGKGGVICSGRECWPYDGTKAITFRLRCPIVINGKEVRTVIVPKKDLRGANNIGAKAEYHNRNDFWWPETGWGPVIAFYNVNQDPNFLMTPLKRSLVEAHFKKNMPLKIGQPGEEGDACFDLVINENGSVLY
jgi:hypothetical protein